jgi:hypothetical protein
MCCFLLAITVLNLYEFFTKVFQPHPDFGPKICGKFCPTRSKIPKSASGTTGPPRLWAQRALSWAYTVSFNGL